MKYRVTVNLHNTRDFTQTYEIDAACEEDAIDDANHLIEADFRANRLVGVADTVFEVLRCEPVVAGPAPLRIQPRKQKAAIASMNTFPWYLNNGAEFSQFSIDVTWDDDDDNNDDDCYCSCLSCREHY